MPGDAASDDGNSDNDVLPDDEDGYDGDINTTLRERTVIEDESRSVDRLNNGGFLTTPELSSFDVTARTEPITMEDLDDSTEGEGYRTAGSNEEAQAPIPDLVRIENEPSAPKLISPIAGAASSVQKRLQELSTSTPALDSSSVAASRTMIWSDGHVKEVEISQTGARLPTRRSNRTRNPPRQ